MVFSGRSLISTQRISSHFPGSALTGSPFTPLRARKSPPFPPLKTWNTPAKRISAGSIPHPHLFRVLPAPPPANQFAAVQMSRRHAVMPVHVAGLVAPDHRICVSSRKNMWTVTGNWACIVDFPFRSIFIASPSNVQHPQDLSFWRPAIQHVHHTRRTGSGWPAADTQGAGRPHRLKILRYLTRKELGPNRIIPAARSARAHHHPPSARTAPGRLGHPDPARAGKTLSRPAGSFGHYHLDLKGFIANLSRRKILLVSRYAIFSSITLQKFVITN